MKAHSPHESIVVSLTTQNCEVCFLDELSYAWLAWKWKKQQAASPQANRFITAVCVQRFLAELFCETCLAQVAHGYQQLSPTSMTQVKWLWSDNDSFQTVILSSRKLLEEIRSLRFTSWSLVSLTVAFVHCSSEWKKTCRKFTFHYTLNLFFTRIVWLNVQGALFHTRNVEVKTDISTLSEASQLCVEYLRNI